MRAGLILFAHGARDPQWAAPFESVVRLVRLARPGQAVRLAYLECMSPELAEAAAALVAEGCVHVSVLPMFLGTGGHVRRDLPVLLDELQRAHPAVRFTLAPAIGEIDSVVAAMAQAAASFAAMHDGT